MNQKDQLLKGVEGLEKVDPEKLDSFRKEMSEKVVPEIKRVVEERRILASTSRHRRIEALKGPEDRKG